MISDAIDRSDLHNLAKLLQDHPEMRNFEVPGIGGTWLHHAAAYGSVDTLRCLLGLGFDVNSSEQIDGAKPINFAAQKGRSDNVAYLLSQGATLDSSSSVANPLFSAVTGKSSEVVRLLLDHGIDVSVRYTKNWDNMDALAFALMWGEMDIADMIADHLANGDSEKKYALLTTAGVVAEANLEPVPSHGGCPDLSEEDN